MEAQIKLKRTDLWSNKINPFDSYENTNKLNSLQHPTNEINLLLDRLGMATNLSSLKAIISLICYLLLLVIILALGLIHNSRITVIYLPLFAFLCFVMFYLMYRHFSNLKLIRIRGQRMLNQTRIQNLKLELTNTLDLIIRKENQSLEEGLIVDEDLTIVQIFHKPQRTSPREPWTCSLSSNADVNLKLAKEDFETEFEDYAQSVRRNFNCLHPYFILMMISILLIVLAETFLILYEYNISKLPDYAVTCLRVLNIAMAPVLIFLQLKLPTMFKPQYETLCSRIELLNRKYNEQGVFVHFSLMNTLICVIKFNRSITEEDKNSILFKDLFLS